MDEAGGEDRLPKCINCRFFLTNSYEDSCNYCCSFSKFEPRIEGEGE